MAPLDGILELTFGYLACGVGLVPDSAITFFGVADFFFGLTTFFLGTVNLIFLGLDISFFWTSFFPGGKSDSTFRFLLGGEGVVSLVMERVQGLKAAKVGWSELSGVASAGLTLVSSN